MKDIILHSGALKAHVNAFGAEWKGLEKDGLEYLYSGDPAYYSRTSPTLFPIIGRFLSDTYYVGNRAYHLPLNGFAMDRNFSVEEEKEDRATFLLAADERTLAMYPFRFTLRVTYALSPEKMTVRYRIRNTDTQALPFGIGCHTAYRWPLTPGENPSDYKLCFEKEETITSFNPFNWKTPGFVLGKTRPLDHSLFENYTRSMTGIRSDWIEYRAPSGHGVRIERKEFPFLAMWTLPDEKAELVCLEPCTSVHAGGATTLNDRMGIIVLPAGDCCDKEFSVTPF